MTSVDLILINPNARNKIYQGLGASIAAVEPPLWCRLLASYIQRHGFSVAIIDAEAEELTSRQTADRILELAPKLIGAVAFGHQPSASTQQMVGVRDLLDELTGYPDGARPSTIVIGGHVSALPKRTLLEENCDYVCKGEGPATILGLLEGKEPSAIPGLVWHNKDDLNVVINPAAPLITDIDHEFEGYGWHSLPMSKYRAHNWQCFDGSPSQPYASIYTSLGCPYKCLSGDTLVNTVYGDIPIKKLVQDGITEIPVFTFDPVAQQAKIATATNIACYGKKQALVRVHFDDGTHIDCTPDHNFLQFKWGNGRPASRSKQWPCEARDLRPGAHVRALKFGINLGYPNCAWKRKGSMTIHRMVATWKIGRPLRRSESIHHIDHDKMNYAPENIHVCASHKEHLSHHSEIAQQMRENNPAKNMTPEWRSKITASITGLKRSRSARKNYRKAALNRSPAHALNLRKAAQKREQRQKDWHWFTAQDGGTYKAASPRDQNDILGRAGFNAHRRIGNHRVVRVEQLDEKQDVYCLTVSETGWFYANGVLVKNCSFCCINAPFDSNRYRMRSPEEVVDEIIYLNHYFGIWTFKITDEMFVLNDAHVKAICNGLIDSDAVRDLNIWAYARVDTIKSHDQLTMMRKAGIRWLALGIESGSKYVRDGAEKKLRNNDIYGVVKEIQAAGINVIGNFIFGLPDDTMESMQSTLTLANELNCEFANFYSAMAYPGSRLYTEAVANKARLPQRWSGYSQHSYDCTPLATATLSSEDVLQFRDEAFREYFSREEYLGMLTRKFGNRAVNQVEAMLKVPLKREILGT